VQLLKPAITSKISRGLKFMAMSFKSLKMK
jgi:hypothetical protein